MVSVRKFSAALGAVVESVDARDASDSDVVGVRQALLDHHVVVLPGQDLSTEEHTAFMARFGPLHFHPFLELMDVPVKYHEMIKQTMESLGGVDNWHTDLVFAPEPVAFGSLHCLIAPEFGGGTEFANLTMAYEQLDSRWTAMVNGLECQYQLSKEMLDNFAKFFGAEARQVWIDALSGTIHPLVRTHPETGRNALYYSPNTLPDIVDMESHAAAALRGYLDYHCTQPNLTARWTWSEGDLLIWDERCTMHYGVRDGYPGDRHMRRVLVNGDKPFYNGL
jgi:taurine dioxygenase